MSSINFKAIRGLEKHIKKYDIISMTDFLFARPSAIEGIGRNIDLFGVLNVYNTSETGVEADQKARRNDIEVLKKDFVDASGAILNGNQV